MSDPTEFLSEEEARRLWHRAAELQAMAAERLEERSRQLAPRGEDEGATPGYSFTHVRAAAVEAGISPEFVDRALAESQQSTGLQPAKRKSAFRRFMVGDLPATVEVSRVYHHSAADVYDGMKRVFPESPYQLALVDTQGQDPLSGAVLVFDVPKYGVVLDGSSSGQSFAYEMAFADLKQLYVSLHPLSHDPPMAEVTIRSPLAKGEKIMFGLATGSTAVLGGAVAVGVGAAVGGPIGLALAAGTLAAGSGLGSLGWRRLAGYSVRRSTKALERLLGAVAGDLQTGGVFSKRGAWPEAGGRPALESGSEALPGTSTEAEGGS